MCILKYFLCASVFTRVCAYVCMIYVGYTFKSGSPTPVRSVKKAELWQPWALAALGSVDVNFSPFSLFHIDNEVRLLLRTG